jgi:hypothetical protein
MSQHRFPPLRLQGPSFLGSHFIHRLVHVLHHVKAVQDMKSLTGLARNHLQVRLPQIATDETQPRRTLLAEAAKEAQQGFYRPVFPYPQQSLAVPVNLESQSWSRLYPNCSRGNRSRGPLALGDHLKTG